MQSHSAFEQLCTSHSTMPWIRHHRPSSDILTRCPVHEAGIRQAAQHSHGRRMCSGAVTPVDPLQGQPREHWQPPPHPVAFRIIALGLLAMIHHIPKRVRICRWQSTELAMLKVSLILQQNTMVWLRNCSPSQGIQQFRLVATVVALERPQACPHH